jgi:type I restriction enzyme S subunit
VPNISKLLPLGWEWASLAEIAAIKGGLTKGKKRKPTDCIRQVPYLRVANVQRGFLALEEVYLIEATENEIEELRLLPGDVLFTEGGDRDKLGRGWVWAGELIECIHQNHVFRARMYLSDLQPKLISLYGNTYGQAYFLGEGKQTTNLASVSLTKLSNLPIPIPPTNEQRRIVAKIEALKARSQRVKEELEAIPALLDQFRQSVLAAAFRGDLTADWREKNPDVEPASVLLERIRAERHRRWEEAELEKMKARGKTPKDNDWKAKYKEPKSLEDIPINYPDSWTWARAEEVCDFITKGTTPAANKMFEQSGDIPFIKVYNLTNRGFLDFSINPTFISKEVHNGELARSKVFPGDILMNIVGPPLGKVAIVPDDYKEWNMNQAIAVYRAMPGIENRFLAYCLLSTQILSTAVHAAKATAGQFNLTLEICRDLPLPIPPTSEQQQIVAMIDRCFAAADLIAEQVANAASQNDVLNQSILAKAFRGELVPQDPNDEPASVLLERIRAEREKLDTKKKAKGKSEKKSRKAKPEPAEPEQLSLPGFE